MLPREQRGLASGDVDALLDRVTAAWQSFVAVAESIDLATPTRLRGWTAREVVVHLGAWDDRTPLAGALESARNGGAGTLPDADLANAEVIAAHRGAPDADVLDAVRRSRDNLVELDRSELRELATAPTMSLLGPLPLAGLLHAGCYELAVHALDLHAAGADLPDDSLLDSGLAALIDVTGALAARHSIPITVTAQTPSGGWATRIDDHGGWRTVPTPAGRAAGPAILGSRIDVLDASAGRAPVPALLVQRRIVVQELGEFLRLAPLVDVVPGIPGAPLLKRAAQTISGVRGVLKRLPGMGRG